MIRQKRNLKDFTCSSRPVACVAFIQSLSLLHLPVLPVWHQVCDRWSQQHCICRPSKYLIIVAPLGVACQDVDPCASVGRLQVPWTWSIAFKYCRFFATSWDLAAFNLSAIEVPLALFFVYFLPGNHGFRVGLASVMTGNSPILSHCVLPVTESIFVKVSELTDSVVKRQHQ